MTAEDLVEAPAANKEPLKRALLRADSDRQLPGRLLMKEAFRLFVFRDAKTSLAGADRTNYPFHNSN